MWYNNYMKKYLLKALVIVISFGIGLSLMLLSSELLASPDKTAFWSGVTLTAVIAFMAGAFALGKIYLWLKWAIEITENEEPI